MGDSVRRKSFEIETHGRERFDDLLKRGRSGANVGENIGVLRDGGWECLVLERVELDHEAADNGPIDSESTSEGQQRFPQFVDRISHRREDEAVTHRWAISARWFNTSTPALATRQSVLSRRLAASTARPGPHELKDCSNLGIRT